MEEWKEYKLEDICSDIFAGGDAKKLKTTQEKNSINRIPVYANSVDKDGLYGYCQTPIVLKPAVTVAARGSGTGFVAYRKEPFVPIVRLITLITKNNVDIQFLYYNLKNRNLKGDGSAIPQITIPMIKKEIVSIPNIHIQRKISGILSSLDNKIELNRRINENLEQQAQALFKSWFVDFEPFKDGQFVDSELGMIPEGWRVGTLEEIGQIIGGGTPSKANSSFYCENGIPWITPKDLSINKSKYISRGENDITEIGYRNSSAKKIPAGSVLFSSRAPIGYIAIANNEVTTNQGFKSVIPTKAGTCFIYLFLQLYKKYIESLATGSTFKEASGALMKSLKLKIPPQSIFENFESMLNPLFSQQCVLESEIDHLSKLRDTLLPRLMSGKLEIKDNSYD